uniref:Neurotransmitter-gated ion-channel ligand-binding domain-containing protein n=1 Tax=Plectus sambesii TaxID=2011161 RepID=A0A914W3Q3_9BILA
MRPRLALLLPVLLAHLTPFHAQSNFGNAGLPPGTVPIASLLDPCLEVQNVTGKYHIETLNHHQYITLEHCLYYHLAREVQTQAGTGNAIALLPPSNGQKQEEINVRFHKVTLQHYYLNEFMKDITVNGFFELSWNDPRLTWKQERWNVKSLKIQSINHIWIPVLTAQAYDTALRNGDSLEMRKIETTKDGNVSAYVNFAMQTYCDDSDFANFPSDLYQCCFSIQPHVLQELIRFQADSVPVFTDPKYFRDYGWRMSGTTPSASTGDDGTAVLNFCINMQRQSATLKIELTLPTTVCAVLLLLTPLLGSFRMQLAAKLFILLLQFLALQLFANRIAAHLGAASATPRIFRVYEFSVTVNTISIATTMALWMCAKTRRTLPPWNWLSKVAAIINKFLCAFNTIDLEQDVRVDQNDKNYQTEWLSAFAAVHGVLMFFLSFIFLIGLGTLI